jgi:hypothetical protein
MFLVLKRFLMYAMQYELALPADYEMGIIRDRVAKRGSSTDAFPGLGLKAYLIQQCGVEGSKVNQYAPFYLWTAIAGMSRFLWGENAGFRGLVESFGRPAVRHWTGVGFESGASASATPRMATRITRVISSDTDLAEVVASAREDMQQLARVHGAHSTALAIDPYHWELMHFTLWEDSAPANMGTRYEVLHLSRPHLQELRSTN